MQVTTTTDLVKLLAPQSNALELQAYIDADVPQIVCVDAGIERLLMNLLTNAMYYTTVGSVSITVSTGMGLSRVCNSCLSCYLHSS